MAIPAARRIIAQCPGCSNEIFFHRYPKLGEFVTCTECGDLVEVVSLSPLTLDWSADIDDDEWSDEWDDYEDYDDDDDDFIDDLDD